MVGLSFKELVAEVSKVLDVKRRLKLSEVDHSYLQNLMTQYRSSEADWAQYARQDPSKGYSRNGVVDFGPNGNLLVLVWNPGRGSAIHDHSKAHCVMKILHGELQEELYKPQIGVPHKYLTHSLARDSVSYIADTIAYHRITNRSETQAVSLHLYTPPYAQLYGCNIFDEETGQPTHVSMDRLYSWKGKILNYNASTAGYN